MAAGSRDQRGRALGGTDASPTGAAVRDGGAPTEPLWRQRDTRFARCTGEWPTATLPLERVYHKRSGAARAEAGTVRLTTAAPAARLAADSLSQWRRWHTCRRDAYGGPGRGEGARQHGHLRRQEWKGHAFRPRSRADRRPTLLRGRRHQLAQLAAFAFQRTNASARRLVST